MVPGSRGPVGGPWTVTTCSPSSLTSSTTWLLLLALAASGARGATYAECEAPERLNTFVASQSSCSQYIYCDGENSFAGECLDDNYFNEAAGNCDDREFVLCLLPKGDEDWHEPPQGSPPWSSEVATTGEGRPDASSGPAQDVGVDVDVGSAANPDASPGTTTATTTSSGAAVTSVTTVTTVTTVTSVTTVATAMPTPVYTEDLEDLQLAPESPDCPRGADDRHPVYLPSSRSCSRYFICFYGFGIPMTCPEQHWFSALSGRCERQEQVECALNRPARVHCVKGVYDFLPHPGNCEYYYFCADGFLLIFQCPHDYTWDYARRSCVHRGRANCFTNDVLRELLQGQQLPATPFRYP